MSLTVGSLFSGIGGLDLGLERAGMKVIWQVEKDEYARRVLKKHWPEVPVLNDIRECFGETGGPPGWAASRGWAIPAVDLICGGFPCQDISVAGKGAGIKEGTRSGLWSEFARIIRELRPRYVLVENVPALRSRGLYRVLGDLASSGYDCEWDGLSASAVGAPHRRDRIFVVAYAKRESGEPWGSLHSGEGAGGWDANRSREREAVANADSPGLAVGIFKSAREELEAFERGGLQGNAWTVEPDVGRVAHGVPARVDRLRCLGNAVVPQVAEFVGRRIMAHAGVPMSCSAWLIARWAEVRRG